MTLAEIQSIVDRTFALKIGDHATATSLVRDAHVLARTLFGSESPYLAELEQLTFRPHNIVYNEGHYMNSATWNTGCDGLKRILRSMHYELSLSLQKKSDLQSPDKVTLPWLFHNLEWQVWITFAGLIGAVFVTGVAIGRNNFFTELIDLVTRAAKQ